MSQDTLQETLMPPWFQVSHALAVVASVAFGIIALVVWPNYTITGVLCLVAGVAVLALMAIDLLINWQQGQLPYQQRQQRDLNVNQS